MLPTPRALAGRERVERALGIMWGDKGKSRMLTDILKRKEITKKFKTRTKNNNPK